MRSKDIEINKEYAVGEGGYLRRGLILEIGTFKQRVYGRGYSSHVTEMKGARVQFMSDNGKLYGEPEWVRLQAVRELWQAHVDADRRRHESLQAMQALATQATEALQRKTGLEFLRVYYTPDRGFQFSHLMSRDLRKLIEAIEGDEAKVTLPKA